MLVQHLILPSQKINDYVYNNLTYEIENRMNIISINRPEKLNALNIETFSEINHAIKSSFKPEVELLLLRSGRKGICGWC